MSKRSLWQRLKLGAKILLSALLVGGIAGAVYERAEEDHDRRRLPQIGHSADIGGCSLNIFCSGQGIPAVILDSGAEACWFDRAGYGWSDVGPFPRTSANMAKDLHELLHRAGVPAPYVLVGHSLGGLNLRVYNSLYLNDVAGAVLVDSAHEDEPRRSPRFMLGRTSGDPGGFPGYFTVLVLGAMVPAASFFPTARQFINWRAFSLTLFLIVLVSVLWEATLAIPYGWWGYQSKQMVGLFIGAWSGLLIEAVCVWIAVTYATVIVFEIVKLWGASDRKAKEIFFGAQRLVVGHKATSAKHS